MLQERIRLRLEALGISADRASLDAKLGRTFIRDILSGKSTKPSAVALVEIAAALKCDLAYLMGSQDAPVTDMKTLELGLAIPVVGTIEAGVFREMRTPDPWTNSEAEFQMLRAPRSQTYPKAKHFAFEVRGDSMNSASGKGIMEGDYALCVDIVDAEHSITDGEIYAVRRTQDGGQTYEWTLKRARLFKDRIELQPESTNPTHRAVTIPRREPASDGDAAEVAVVGLMYGTYSHYSRYA